jgi:hypothetical protein
MVLRCTRLFTSACASCNLHNRFNRYLYRSLLVIGCQIAIPCRDVSSCWIQHCIESLDTRLYRVAVYMSGERTQTRPDHQSER